MGPRSFGAIRKLLLAVNQRTLDDPGHCRSSRLPVAFAQSLDTTKLDAPRSGGVVVEMKESPRVATEKSPLVAM